MSPNYGKIARLEINNRNHVATGIIRTNARRPGYMRPHQAAIYSLSKTMALKVYTNCRLWQNLKAYRTEHSQGGHVLRVVLELSRLAGSGKKLYRYRYSSRCSSGEGLRIWKMLSLPAYSLCFLLFIYFSAIALSQFTKIQVHTSSKIYTTSFRKCLESVSVPVCLRQRSFSLAFEEVTSKYVDQAYQLQST